MNKAVIPQKATAPRLRDVPSLIERVWPVQKISVEAQKERKAVHGQTLTGLGSYWKGRKPLVLVRACVLGALLPSSGDDEADLAVFESLMGMDDEQIVSRFKDKLSVAEIKTYGSSAQQEALLVEEKDVWILRPLPKDLQRSFFANVIARMPYNLRVQKLLRPEEVFEDELTKKYVVGLRASLGTTATDLPTLVAELGEMRFGRRPIVIDTFCGGGSIPFEAARLGCEVRASDLNPVACMLTWGALNVVGGGEDRRKSILAEQAHLAAAVDREITSLEVEHDDSGNRAKVYLYCLETRCPITGWLVPLAPSWIISEARAVVATLVPDYSKKRFDLVVVQHADDGQMGIAAVGTVRDGRLVYELDGETYSSSIKAIRGDQKGIAGEKVNDLRLWDKQDFIPRHDDILRERLYCIQWITKETLGAARQKTFFAGPTESDLKREALVETIVRENLASWQSDGLISDMEIETGKENEGPIRTNGWKFWHQMFMPRVLLTAAIIAQNGKRSPAAAYSLFKYLDNNSKACRWKVSQSGGDGGAVSTFDSQALKTIFNWAVRSLPVTPWQLSIAEGGQVVGIHSVACADARATAASFDIAITDPPYADAVNYHEITEFFIAWLRRRTPDSFAKWTWDSRRPLAIKGDGEDFRKGMVDAYAAMARYMPDNGLQIVMFTHQDVAVWADMAQIFWGSGLRVMAAWYIATETTSELKKGGYVQGTVILVLRKRMLGEHGYKDEIVQEVKAEVAGQIDTMSGLNQSLKGHGRIENLFEDADLQMAGYAAALRVLTRYTSIDGVDMTKEAIRVREKGQKGLVGEIIDFAVQIANEHMVPEGMAPRIWSGLSGSERFYFKMMDVEETGAKKLDNYQNFSRAFRVPRYDDLMGSVEPNKARLKTAAEFKKLGFEGSEFGASKTRALLYAIHELEKEIDGDEVLSHLRDLIPDYFDARESLIQLADYVAKKRHVINVAEARAASILHGLIRNERFG